MAERRTIGQILLSHGRITEEEMDQALEYQRDHGGYFGEALLACGLVRREELEWGLAAQCDIPYVFPEADAVDPAAAALVPPEWALAHLVLPIMQTARSLTVLVESPLETRALEELRGRVDRPIRLALSSAPVIRSLIRRVYGPELTAAAEERARLVELESALASALEAGADRFGISTRRHVSWVWWDEDGTVRRRVLEGIWRTDLNELLVPPPEEALEGRDRATWSAQLKRRGVMTPVDVRYMADESGHEYLFRPVRTRSRLERRFPPPRSSVLAEIRQLARSRSARFLVTAEPEEVGHEILPHLPALLLDPSWRSIHVHPEGRPGGEDAFSITVPRDPQEWAGALDLLGAFQFDGVTVDLWGKEAAWVAAGLELGGAVFLRWPTGDEPRAAYEAGVRWRLHLARDRDGGLAWSLDPLHV